MIYSSTDSNQQSKHYSFNCLQYRLRLHTGKIYFFRSFVNYISCITYVQCTYHIKPFLRQKVFIRISMLRLILNSGLHMAEKLARKLYLVLTYHKLKLELNNINNFPTPLPPLKPDRIYKIYKLMNLIKIIQHLPYHQPCRYIQFLTSALLALFLRIWFKH